MGPSTKIHVDLPADTHRRLRVKVALADATIQEYVEHLVSQAVKDVRIPPSAGENKRG